jgi:hypothetical protein
VDSGAVRVGRAPSGGAAVTLDLGGPVGRSVGRPDDLVET